MKSKIFNVSLIFKDLVVLFCCLSAILILTHCTNQEKKINTPTKTEGKDTLIQQPSIETKIDTSRGVFLIYKFGDTYADVDKKTDYLVRKNILSKREEDEGPPFGGKKSHYEYKIYTDPKFDFSKGGTYLGDQLVSSEDSYVIMEVSFSYSEEGLFQIKLYNGITNEQLLSDDKRFSWRTFWEVQTPQNLRALLDVYRKKYKGWTIKSNRVGLYDYFYMKGNTQISLEHYLCSITITYTDLVAERKLQKQEKENLKKKMDEKNKGI
jgi:hypothetical protein